MDPTDGQDIPADLHSELTSLRRRVQELEGENEKLRSQLSNCRCPKEVEVEDEKLRPQLPSCAPLKEEDAKVLDNAFACSNRSTRRVDQIDELHAIEMAKSTGRTSADPFVYLSKPVMESLNGLHAETSAKCKQHLSKEQPDFGHIWMHEDYRGHMGRSKGCQPSTIQHCAKRYVALKIMYFGQRFYGFASEAQIDPTIESEVFKALERTKLLVSDRAGSQYSRCGRTDKGVSSTGQVISMYLRSNLKDSGENGKKNEIDYVRVLNRVLPKDIRVLGWCDVPPDFSARFSCLSREYRYLFWRRNLDILAMQKAAKKFIGVHDFRNFCKMDAKNVNNYRRHITVFEISSCNQRSDNDELWAMMIKGSAFLWHQVRCMVAVLFLIGQGLESPNVVEALLDTNKMPRKPQYSMAPELPLILRFCEFEDVNFVCSSDARGALHEHLMNEYQTCMLQAAIYHEALGCLSTPDDSSLDHQKKKRGHISLMLRPTEQSYEERRAKLDLKGTEKS